MLHSIFSQKASEHVLLSTFSNFVDVFSDDLHGCDHASCLYSTPCIMYIDTYKEAFPRWKRQGLRRIDGSFG